MRRISLLLALLLCTGATLELRAQTEERLKFAVYTSGDASTAVKNIAQNKVITALTNSGRYQMIERSTEFLQAITKEQKYQQSGGVDDNQITSLGVQFGAERICVVNITLSLPDSYIYIATRMIDVEKATSQEAGEADGEYNGLPDLGSVVEKAVNSLIGAAGTSVGGGRPSVSNGTNRGKITVNGVTFEMVAVEGGTFTMGCTSEQGGECDDDESPFHRVTLSSYMIGKYEVTQDLWQSVMGNNPSNFKGSNLPVEMVSWIDIQEFLAQLSQATGLQFRLPTEAEWEYAARGGNKSKGYKFSGSNMVDYAGWYSGNSGSRTHPVGQKLPNELGIYDMSGNVWEWCYDWKGSYSSSSQTDPVSPSSGSYRVVRGGSWYNDASICRVSSRGGAPGGRYSDGGFRLVLVP